MNKKGLVIVVAGIVVLAALFLLLRPRPEGPAQGVPAPGVPTSAALPQAFQLTLKGGRLASGPAVIQVAQGAEVVLDVVADQDDELHLHGYNLSLDLRANAPSQLRFVADKSGRFEYELHRAHSELGALEVLPK